MTRFYGREVFRGVVAQAKLLPHWRLAADPGSAELADLAHCDAAIVQVERRERDDAAGSYGIPIVNVSGSQWSDRFPQVATDDEAVGRLAAEHLLGRGFRHLGFFQLMPGDAGFVARRLDGFRDELARRGIACHVHATPPEAHAEGQRGRPVLDDLVAWLDGLPRPLGVFAPVDAIARLVVDAAGMIGTAVPEDIAVLGVDDELMTCESCVPPLSSIAIPGFRIGQLAAETLERVSAGEAVPPQTLLPPVAVVTRRSTDTFAVDDTGVRRALQHLAEHAAEPVTIDDAAAAARVPRRSLERRFRAALGCSPHEKLVELRVERAKRLLAETDAAMSRVAAAAGFSDQKKLWAHIKAATGLTPTQYRRRHSAAAARHPSGG